MSFMHAVYHENYPNVLSVLFVKERESKSLNKRQLEINRFKRDISRTTRRYRALYLKVLPPSAARYLNPWTLQLIIYTDREAQHEIIQGEHQTS